MRIIGNGLFLAEVYTLLVGVPFQVVYRPLYTHISSEQVIVDGGESAGGYCYSKSIILKLFWSHGN